MEESSIVSVCLAATFTVDDIIQHVKHYASRSGLATDVEIAGFNQVIQSLLDPNSFFFRQTNGINVVMIRPCDLAGVVEDIVKALKAYNENPNAKRPVVAMIVPQTTELSSPKWKELANILAKYNKIIVIPTSEIVRCTGGFPETFFDAETDKLAAMPYRPEGIRSLGLMVARVLSYLTRPPTKVIAVDCDNTLWQGICSDTGGASAVKGNIPLMQLLVNRMKNNGMLLATFSKNMESDVKAAFEAHPEWPLSFDDFVAHYVNWEPKSKNLQACAEKLSLGLNSFCFIDDNPMEIGEVTAGCPSLSMVIHAPNTTDASLEEIAAFPDFIWPLDAFRQAVPEDLKKTEQYRAETKRQEAMASSATSLTDFIASLNLKVNITTCKGDDEARVLQLSQKSNQFNFTTRRLLTMPGDLDCTVIRVQDKYGDYGLVGILFYSFSKDALVLDNFIMSCRVLGRGVEHKMLTELARIAKAKSLDSVEITFAKSEKNLPAGMFLETVGLLPEGAQRDGGVEMGKRVSQKFSVESILANSVFDPERVSTYGAKLKKATNGDVQNSDESSAGLEGNLDYSRLSREQVKAFGTRNTSLTETTKGKGVISPESAIIEAIRSVLGDEVALIVEKDQNKSLYEVGLDSLQMVRIYGELQRILGRDALAHVTPTTMQRKNTVKIWINLLSGEASTTGEEKNKSSGAGVHDDCMFKVKGDSASSGKAPLVFLHPAGGAVGPFNKMFKALDTERDVWAIEHPYFVNDAYDPRKVSVAKVCSAYADAIIHNLNLKESKDTNAFGNRKWTFVTYSAGGLWLNETFHQLRARGCQPSLVVLLDAGWGVLTGPWEYPICCGGNCCFKNGCACCPTVEPFYSCCEGLFWACNHCWLPCMNMKYGPRNPKINKNQPFSYNEKVRKLGKIEPRMVKNAMGAPYDFFRLGTPGRMREEPSPVKEIMTRDPPEEKTVECAAKNIRKYVDKEFGAEGQGAKWERMAMVMTHGTFANLFGFKAVPFGDVPLAVYQATQPLMRTYASVWYTRDYNIVDQKKYVVNLNMPEFKEIFPNDHPAGRAHQLFTSDDAIVQDLIERIGSVLKKLEL